MIPLSTIKFLVLYFFISLCYSSKSQNFSTKIITSYEELKELAKPYGLESEICGWGFLRYCEVDSINRYFDEQAKWKKEHAHRLRQYSAKPFRTVEQLRVLAKKFNVEEEISKDSSLIYFDSTFANIYLKLLSANHYYFLKKPQRTLEQQAEIARSYGFEERVLKDSVFLFFDSTVVVEWYKHEQEIKDYSQKNKQDYNENNPYFVSINYGILQLTLRELLDIAKKYGAEKYLTSNYALLIFRKEAAEENFKSNAESGLKHEEMNKFSAAQDTIKTMKQFYNILDKYPLAKSDYIKNAGSIEKFEQKRNEEINRKYRIYKGKGLCEVGIWINDATPYDKDEGKDYGERIDDLLRKKKISHR